MVCIGFIAAQMIHRGTRCPHRCTGTTITATATCETFTTRCLECGALINEYTDCV